jgi:ADP-L-glycero-D-manno-heptose 6-epimerase
MILVTGAAGFIGSVVVQALNEDGIDDLLLVDHLGTSDKWRNLLGKRFRDYLDHQALLDRIARGDLDRAKVTAVLHIGARTDTTERDADLLLRLNFEYSRALCGWALARRARFVYASSAAVYGDGSLGFSDADELTPRLRPLNAYGFSKWLFDCWVLHKGLGRKVVGLRFFNVYGPNEYHKGRMASVVFHAYPRAKREGSVLLFESDRPDVAHGEQKRDFVYVKDAGRVVRHFLRKRSANGIFNVGSGQARTFRDLGVALLKACRRSPRGVRYVPMPEDLKGKYQYFTQADLTRLRRSGFEDPTTGVEAGVMEYVRQYLDRPDPHL